MNITVLDNETALGRAAARQAATLIRHALSNSEYINIILATGASQFQMLENLTKESNIEWSRVRMFHLDEYLGIGMTHPASFRKYLTERFINQVPGLKEVHFIQGDAVNPLDECDRLNEIISNYQIDVAMVGIGENGHLAFNDPPADFETTSPYIIVELDDACRQQQLNEGWFDSFDAVPSQAITMSIQQILKSKAIVCTVPDKRKAQAVEMTINGEIHNNAPASILRRHNNVNLFLDIQSANGIESGIRV